MLDRYVFGRAIKARPYDLGITSDCWSGPEVRRVAGHDGQRS